MANMAMRTETFYDARKGNEDDVLRHQAPTEVPEKHSFSSTPAYVVARRGADDYFMTGGISEGGCTLVDRESSRCSLSTLSVSTVGATVGADEDDVNGKLERVSQIDWQ